MSVQVEKLEKNTVKLTIEVPAEELEKALQEAYNKLIIQLRNLFCFDLMNFNFECSFFSSEIFCMILLRECNIYVYVITGVFADQLSTKTVKSKIRRAETERD